MKPSTITKVVLAGAAVGCVVVAPGVVLAMAPLVKLLLDAQHTPLSVSIPEESDPQKVRRSLYRLERNKYVRIKRVGKLRYKLELTRKGKKLLRQHNFYEFKIEPKQKWDGNWRMFVFDVPERQRAVRDTLRDKLKKLGFFQFQKSVWIYPFECEEGMRYVCEFLSVQPYVLIFTGTIHNDQLLRKYFLQEGILRKSDLKS
jgi:DNA-binding MarR family transcriptional regulator